MMLNTPKVLTVSIAAYNVSSTLEEALKPFLQCKNLSDIEVLIVNDGSKDNTAEIAKKYVRQYPESIFLINKKNGGWGSTLNAGIQAGTGKYFKQLDGDDYYSYENLEDFVEFLKYTDADMVYTPFVTFDDNTGGILSVKGQYRDIPQRKKMNLYEMDDFAPAMHTLTVRMEILKNNPIHITEHCFYTDVEFVLKTCNFSKTIIFYEYPIYYYRLARSGQSMSIKGVRSHYKDHLKMVYTMLKYEKESVTDEDIRKIFRLRMFGACEMQYIFFFALQHTQEQKKELIEFDSILKREYPEYYYSIKNKAVQLLRKFNFYGYKCIGSIQTARDKRKKINIFEGC